MLKKILMVLCCCGILSACNLSKKPPVSQTPSVETETLIVLPDGNGQVIDETTFSAPPLSESSIQDVIVRMRKGFKFPDFSSSLVRFYEKQFAKNMPELIELSAPYLFYIVSELDKHDLPMELALLPAVESSFKPQAVSRSGAAGLWQFLASTGRDYRLFRNHWYDDRRDVIKSTQAAIAYLMKINTRFNGDWFLTLAGYNAGPGGVERLVKRQRRRGHSTKYAKLPLRNETRRYVPKLMALKNIILAPSQFGVKLPLVPNKPYFNVHQVESVQLNVLAENLGIKQADFWRLNAGFLRSAYADKQHRNLLLPVEVTAKQLVNAVTISGATKIPQVVLSKKDTYIVKKGDTLHKIARRHGVSVVKLRQLNGLRSSFLSVNQRLRIRQNTSIDRQKLTHKVRSGETLWSISRRYGVNVKEIAHWNRLSQRAVLSLGQPLLIFLP